MGICCSLKAKSVKAEDTLKIKQQEANATGYNEHQQSSTPGNHIIPLTLL
jgi:hypothetical protein